MRSNLNCHNSKVNISIGSQMKGEEGESMSTYLQALTQQKNHSVQKNHEKFSSVSV